MNNMKKLFVIHGPNLNMLGIREPEIYGKATYEDLLQYIKKEAADKGFETEFYQSNHEGDLIDYIQAAYGKADCILINPGAYAHTSIALADALKILSSAGIPCAEVHLTDVTQREEYRRHSYTGEACCIFIAGKGFEGYGEAIAELAEI